MSDVRKLGGSMDDHGDPYSRHATSIDMTDALLLDNTTVCLVEGFRTIDETPNSEVLFAVEMRGKINKKDEHARLLVLLNADGAAAIATQLLSCAMRAGKPEIRDEVVASVIRRWQEAPK